MKLPHHEQAVVPESKITSYLLSEEKSGGKAGFFTQFGFSVAQWEVMREALLVHAAAHDITQTVENPHGTKYIIEGELQTPDGRNPVVRAVWIIETGQEAARLVTAYPL